VLVTGFGPFPGRAENPSRDVARALEREPPPGVRVVARELPVTFQGAPSAVHAALADLAPERPKVLLGLGVQPDPWFRLERRSRGSYTGPREGNDGRNADQSGLVDEPERATDLELEPLAASLRAAGARDVRISNDAGGYVCDITYHALLTAAESSGVTALFLHVPPAEVLSAEEQTPIVRALVAALAR
jgi:pyroglutamyl-peptidase